MVDVSVYKYSREQWAGRSRRGGACHFQFSLQMKLFNPEQGVPRSYKVLTIRLLKLRCQNFRAPSFQNFPGGIPLDLHICLMFSMLELCPPSPPQLLSWVPVQHYCITRLSLLYSYYLIIITGLIKPVRTRLKMVFHSKFPILAIFRNVHKVSPDTDLNNICMFLKPCMGKLGNVVAETLGFLPMFPSLPTTIKYVFEISSNLVWIKFFSK